MLCYLTQLLDLDRETNSAIRELGELRELGEITSESSLPSLFPYLPHLSDY
jgi:hypothetical protein